MEPGVKEGWHFRRTRRSLPSTARGENFPVSRPELQRGPMRIPDDRIIAANAAVSSTLRLLSKEKASLP
jgi:hypothetical protein